MLHPPFGRGRELIAAGRNTFRFADDADPSVLIAESDEGHGVLIVGSDYCEQSSHSLWILQIG